MKPTVGLPGSSTPPSSSASRSQPEAWQFLFIPILHLSQAEGGVAAQVYLPELLRACETCEPAEEKEIKDEKD